MASDAVRACKPTSSWTSLGSCRYFIHSVTAARCESKRAVTPLCKQRVRHDAELASVKHELSCFLSAARGGPGEREYPGCLHGKWSENGPASQHSEGSASGKGDEPPSTVKTLPAAKVMGARGDSRLWR